jgi:hypothetical protein
VTTEKELVSFIRASVLQSTQSQQISQSFPTVSRDIPVFRTRSAAPAASGPEQDAIAIAEQAAAAAPLKLAFRNGQGPQAVTGADIVSDEADADLVYDVAAGTVEKRVAGVVAENVQPQGLTGIVAKWRAIAFLQAMAGGSIQAFEVAGGSRTFKRGEQFTVGLGASRHHFMTLFNLPPDGKVEFFWPENSKDAQTDWTKADFAETFGKLKVDQPPYGAENLVAILTAEPAPALAEALKSMPSAAKASGLAATLRSNLAGKDFQVGVVGIFTTGGK